MHFSPPFHHFCLHTAFIWHDRDKWSNKVGYELIRLIKSPIPVRNFNVSVDAIQSSLPHCHGQRSLLRCRPGFTVQDSCFYSHSHQVRYIYIFKRGKSGVPRVQKGFPGKGMALSHSTWRFHTPTHSRPRRQIWVQVWGNCTQKKVVTTKTHTHKEKRSGKLESEH